MAGRLGKLTCKNLLDSLFSAGAAVYASLHTGDPGVDGQTANEATGTGYERVALDSSDWHAATNANPAVAKNANPIEYPQAGEDWSSGVSFTHVGLWSHATLSTEAKYIGCGELDEAKPVLDGDTATVPAEAVSVSLA